MENQPKENFDLSHESYNHAGQPENTRLKVAAIKFLPVSLSIQTKSDSMRVVFNAILHYWPLVIPLILFLPGLTAFPYPSSDAIYSDLAISHFPNAVFLKHALMNWHELPFWSSTILSGYPFAANPLSGLWYPPGWLALFFPLPLGFNLLVALHILWGGIGMLCLLRSEGLGVQAALLGALAFESMPKLFAHYGAGHLTLLYAIPWTPWLLFAGRRAFQAPNAANRLAQPGLVLALIFLADVRWAVFAGILWFAYSINRRINRQHIFYLIRQAGLAVLLSAPLAIPLLEYTRLSTRVELAITDVFTYSLPPSKLLGLIFPDMGGFHEWIVYPGATVFVLSLLAILWGQVRSRAKFWIWASVFSMVFSLGSSIPGITVLAAMPGLDLLRVPSRALFITGMALAIVAAYSLDYLMKGITDAERRKANLLMVGLAALVLALSGALWVVSQKLSLNFVWGTVMLLAALIWVSLSFRGQIRSNLWIASLIGLVVIDLGLVDHSLFAFRPAASVEAEGQSAARFLATHPGAYRVYSPSYSMPQQTAALYGLELADGVDPLQLQSYVSFMQPATGVPWNGYSVTLPPFTSGDPGSDNAGYLPDPELLGLLNVRYVLSEFDLQVKGLALRNRFGSTRIYENLDFRPRAWVQSATNTNDMPIQAAGLIDWRPNRIVLKVDEASTDTQITSSPRLLVLSEVAYPGWHVSVDGKPAALQVFDGILRAVKIGPGAHQVVFTYRPISVYVGLILGLIGLLWLILAPKGLRAQPRNSR